MKSVASRSVVGAGDLSRYLRVGSALWDGGGGRRDVGVFVDTKRLLGKAVGSVDGDSWADGWCC